MVGSTDLSRRIDPEDLRIVIRKFQDICVRVIDRYDGYISRYMGDGILAMFGYPTAHEDDAYRAVCSALELVDQVAKAAVSTPNGSVSVSVRCGIATGMVIAGDVIGEGESREEPIVGETPNLASRLQQIARENTVFISTTTRRLLGQKVECDYLGTFPLKGYPDEVPAYQVVRRRPFSERTPLIESTPKLAGRVDELAMIRNLFSLDANGEFIAVCGEPGIGKSRLIEEARRQGTEYSGSIIEGFCSPYHINSELYPVVELFRGWYELEPDDSEVDIEEKISRIHRKEQGLNRIISVVASVIYVSHRHDDYLVTDPAGRPNMDPVDAFCSLIRHRASQGSPVAIIVEDVHWADPSTMELLARISEPADVEGLSVVITSRKEQALSTLPEKRWKIVKLTRLDRKHSVKLLDQMAENQLLTDQLRESILRRTDGVPLFIEELTNTVIQSIREIDQFGTECAADKEEVLIPVTLRDSLMARLDSLKTAKEVAQMASVIGRTFHVDLLSSVTTISRRMLDYLLTQLVKEGILTARTDGTTNEYHFRHSLIQDVAYDSMLSTKRVEIHRRVAESLDDKVVTEFSVRPELIARHYSFGKKPESAVRFWRLAAEQALSRSANLEALSHSQAGIRELDAISNPEHHADTAVSLYLSLGRSLSHTTGYGLKPVDDAYQKALSVCQQHKGSTDKVRILQGLHGHYMLKGPLDRAASISREISEISAELNDEALISNTNRIIGWTAFCQGDLDTGRRYLKRSLETYELVDTDQYRKIGATDTGPVAAANLGFLCWFEGSNDEAIRLTRRAIKIASREANVVALIYALTMCGAVRQCNRDVDGVRAFVDRAIEHSGQLGARYWRAWGACLSGWATAYQIDPVRGLEEINEALGAYQESGAVLFIPYILVMRSELLTLIGEDDRALEGLYQALETEREMGIYFYSAETHRQLGAQLYRMGSVEQSVSAYRSALDIARGQRARSMERQVCRSIDGLDSDDPGVVALKTSIPRISSC